MELALPDNRLKARKKPKIKTWRQKTEDDILD